MSLGSLDLDHTAEAFRTQYDGGKLDGFVEGVSTQGSRWETLRWPITTIATCRTTGTFADEYVLFDKFFSFLELRQHPQPHVPGHWQPRRHRRGRSRSPGWVGRHPDHLRPAAGGRHQLEVLRGELRPHDHLPVSSLDQRCRPRRPGDLGTAAQLRAVHRHPELSSKIVNLDQYYEDAASGNLPAVAFIAPSGDSEHPTGQHSGRADSRAHAVDAADARSTVELVGLPLVLRRLGRLVRPRQAAASGPVRLRVQGAGIAGQPLCQTRLRRFDHTSTSPRALKFIETNWKVEPSPTATARRTRSWTRSTSTAPAPAARIPRHATATHNRRATALVRGLRVLFHRGFAGDAAGSSSRCLIAAAGLVRLLHLLPRGQRMGSGSRPHLRRRSWMSVGWRPPSRPEVHDESARIAVIALAVWAVVGLWPASASARSVGRVAMAGTLGAADRAAALPAW